jgi:vitamin B12 transporter
MRRLFLSVLLCGTALPAFAQDATLLPDSVVTATRIPTLIETIPAGVTVIDRATIEERGYATLADALTAVPGLHLVQSGGAGGNASVFMRGTDSDHVLVLRDGVPMNDPADPNGAFNFGVDTLADVDRIEIVRGPMSGLYGSGAIGGVINLITKHGTEGVHATAEIAVGIPRALHAAAGLSGATNGFDYSLHVEDQADRGFDTVPRRESVYAAAPKGYQADLGSIELGYTPVDGTRFFVSAHVRQAVFNLAELGSPTYDALNYRGYDNEANGRVGVTSRLFDGRWETALTFAGVTTDRHYIEPLEAADPNMTSGDTRYHGRRADLQWNNTVHLPDLGPATGSALLFGYEHIADAVHSALNESFAGYPYVSDVHAAGHSDAGHAGVQTTLFQRLTLTADGREENASYGGSAFTWRTGGVLALPEVWSRLKLSYGTGFRAPSLFDLFGVDNFGYVGNPNLRPEHSAGWEAGWTVDVPAFGRRDAATVEATYFNTRIRDLIETVYNADYSASTTANVARAAIEGVETSVTLRPVRWAEAVLTYTWTDARDLASNAYLLRRPVNRASASLRLSPLPGLVIAPEVVYTGGFWDYLTDDFGMPAGVGLSKGGTVANLSVSYDITPNFTAFITGTNLGGSRFEPANGFQMPGTQFLAGLRARY